MDIYELLTTPMEYSRKLRALAQAAENSVQPLAFSAATTQLLKSGALDDMAEGNAPWRPRYILPDYQRLFTEGCRWLELAPPTDLDEALYTLLIFYTYVPSITSYPVYLGALDQLLAPFAEAVAPETLERKLALFLRAVDRMFPDNFVHYNIGPRASKVGQALLAAEAKLKQSVPNLSLLCSAETEADFLELAVQTALKLSKPYFVNNVRLEQFYDGRCGVASCYNTLPIGGGAYTLTRINLKELAAGTDAGREEFIEAVLPAAARALAELTEKRIRFLVETSGFFASSFLVDEGFLRRERFTAMAGIVGLAEAVAMIGEREGQALILGRDQAAAELGQQIIARLESELAAIPMPYCEISGGRALLHAQVGMPFDVDTTPGTRIATEHIPPLLDQLNVELPFHKFFPAGTSSILVFDQTAAKNPAALTDIIRGAFAQGALTLSMNSVDSDVVRITGYLVRRKDLERMGWHSVDDNAVETVERLGVLRRRANS
ncbi:MAG: YjjI family glycine radical enzyme [Firmicutes bacterium]|nr:YjjI family glycine radical enzyme [Bacillota bacterium]